MSSNRLFGLLGVAAAGGVGYYLYNAGGDPKVAQKKMEADASRLAANLKEDIPGRGKEVKKDAEATMSQAGSKFDQASYDAKAKLSEAEAKARDMSQKAGKDISAGIDKFDKAVEDKAAQAKSGLKGWFK